MTLLQGEIWHWGACYVWSSSFWWDQSIYYLCTHVEFQLFLYLHEEALFHFDLLWIAGQYSVWWWSCLYIFWLYIWLYLTDCIDFFKMLIFGFLTPTMFEQAKKSSVKVKNFLHLNSTFNPQDHHQIKVSWSYVFYKYFSWYPLFHSMGYKV